MQKILQGVPAQSAFNAQLWLAERYETEYGIHDHNNDPDPYSLAVVGENWSESLRSASMLALRRKAYIDLKVWDYFHCSWAEFMQHTRSEVEEMLKAAREGEESRISREEKANQALKDISNNLGVPGSR